ncbi:lipoprotein NlpI [Bacteroidales bacterium Barb7]|nr:lipoprotein NlpI [Bacteroidales bacterium Barb7]
MSEEEKKRLYDDGIIFMSEEEVIANYDKAIELNPEDYKILIRKGNYLYHLEKYDEAVECYDEAIKLNSGNGTAWNNKGKALYYLEKYDEAIKCCNEAISLEPENLKFWYNKGLILAEQGEYSEAANCFTKAKGDILGILIRLDYDAREQVAKEMLNNDNSLKYDNFFKKATEMIADDQKEYYKDIYIHSLQIIRLLYIDEEIRVAHYTKKSTSQQLLFGGSKFRLNLITTSNDPKEGCTLLDYLLGEQPKQEETYRAFAGCFTFNHESLNQFRLYGKEDDKEATGVSIVVKESFFSEEIKVSTSTYLMKENIDISKVNLKEKHPLFRCIYIDPKKGHIYIGHKEEGSDDYKSIFDMVNEKIEELKDKIQKGLEKYKLDSKVISELLINLRYLTKHAAFKEEQECRIIQIKQLGDEKIKISEEYDQMYIEYMEMQKHIERIHFAPKAAGFELYRDVLKHTHQDLGIKCEQSNLPFL